MDRQSECSFKLASKKARERRAHAFLFNLFLFVIFHKFSIFRIIMSFRKPCQMPFRKLIPPFTLTGFSGVRGNLPVLTALRTVYLPYTLFCNFRTLKRCILKVSIVVRLHCLWNSTKHALKHCSLSMYTEHLGEGGLRSDDMPEGDERRLNFCSQLLVIMVLTCQ